MVHSVCVCIVFTFSEKLELEAKLEIRETDYECRIKDLGTLKLYFDSIFELLVLKRFLFWTIRGQSLFCG